MRSNGLVARAPPVSSSLIILSISISLVLRRLVGEWNRRIGRGVRGGRLLAALGILAEARPSRRPGGLAHPLLPGHKKHNTGATKTGRKTTNESRLVNRHRRLHGNATVSHALLGIPKGWTTLHRLLFRRIHGALVARPLDSAGCENNLAFC